MKLFALVIILGVIGYFTVFKWIANWMNKRPEFPHEDECFMCNRESCIEPYLCEIIAEDKNERVHSENQTT